MKFYEWEQNANFPDTFHYAMWKHTLVFTGKHTHGEHCNWYVYRRSDPKRHTIYSGHSQTREEAIRACDTAICEDIQALQRLRSELENA